jgi:hypothetical protein
LRWTRGMITNGTTRASRPTRRAIGQFRRCSFVLHPADGRLRPRTQALACCHGFLRLDGGTDGPQKLECALKLEQPSKVQATNTERSKANCSRVSAHEISCRHLTD